MQPRRLCVSLLTHISAGITGLRARMNVKLEEIGRGGVCRDSEDGVFVPNESPLNYFHFLGSRLEGAFEWVQSAIMRSA